MYFQTISDTLFIPIDEIENLVAQVLLWSASSKENFSIFSKLKIDQQKQALVPFIKQPNQEFNDLISAWIDSCHDILDTKMKRVPIDLEETLALHK